MRIEVLTPARFDEVAPALAEVLVDAVDDGASVGFLAPLALDEAQRWWHGALRGPCTTTWLAVDDDAVVGVVQLKPVGMPNGSHRGEVSKLLVHRRARGRGTARQLLAALEEEAVARGRWLLVLDTRAGSLAEAVYEGYGWQRLGVVDDYAADPDGRLAPCTFFTKRLRAPSSASVEPGGAGLPRVSG